MTALARRRRPARPMIAAVALFGLLACGAPPSRAQAPDAPRVTFAGFVDTYYAWDALRPASFDRAYTTQAARHAEFNVNLAFVEARLAGPRTRGRLALQAGTSVQSNYAGEPRLGTISGPDVSRFVQEATAGWRVAPGLWVDGGVFPAHVGYESWVSRDNPTYTRSLVAEYSPYYEAGAKLSWAARPSLAVQAAVVNGWQNVSAENASPGAGVRVDWTARPNLVLTYDDLVANVAPDTSDARVRIYHDLMAQWDPSRRWRVVAVLSLGTQTRSAPGGASAVWGGGALIGRWQVSPTVALAGRVEGFGDPDAIVLATGTSSPFRAVGGSIGVDVAPDPALRWRTEVRAFGTRDPVWPGRDAGRFGTRAGALVTSLSLTM